MRHTFAVVLLATLVSACSSTESRAPAPTGSGNPAEVEATTAVPVGELTDAALAKRWFDAMESQLRVDAVAVGTGTYATKQQAEAALTMLTPAGFVPRPEYFKPLFDAIPREVIGRRLSDYAMAHPDEVERLTTAMLERLRPALTTAQDNVRAQFVAK